MGLSKVPSFFPNNPLLRFLVVSTYLQNSGGKSNLTLFQTMPQELLEIYFKNIDRWTLAYTLQGRGRDS